MKRIVLLATLFVSLSTFAQIPISQLPTYTGNPAGGYMPIVISGTTHKINASLLMSSGSGTTVPSNWFIDTVYKRNDTVFYRKNGITYTVGKFQADLTNYYTKTESDGRYVTVQNPGNHLQSGGIVTWSGTGLSFDVTAANYYINGTRYTTPVSQVTLAAADPTYPRIDVIAVDTNGVVVKLTGTPAATPVKPQVDINAQVELTFIQVDAGATTPNGISKTLVYDENVEWPVAAPFMTLDAANTTAPYHGSKAISLSWTIAQSIYWTNTSALNPEGYSALKLFMRLPAALSTKVNLTIRLENTVYLVGGSPVVSQEVPLTSYGLDRGVTNTYQNISIPFTALSPTSPFDRIRIRLSGTNINGLYIDYVQLQSGVPTSTSGQDLSNYATIQRLKDTATALRNSLIGVELDPKSIAKAGATKLTGDVDILSANHYFTVRDSAWKNYVLFNPDELNVRYDYPSYYMHLNGNAGYHQWDVGSYINNRWTEVYSESYDGMYSLRADSSMTLEGKAITIKPTGKIPVSGFLGVNLQNNQVWPSSAISFQDSLSFEKDSANYDKWFYDAGLSRIWQSTSPGLKHKNLYTFGAYRNFWEKSYRDDNGRLSISRFGNEADSNHYQWDLNNVSDGSQQYLRSEHSALRSYFTLGYNRYRDSAYKSSQLLFDSTGAYFGVRKSGYQFGTKPAISGVWVNTTGNTYLTDVVTGSGTDSVLVKTTSGEVRKIAQSDIGGGSGATTWDGNVPNNLVSSMTSTSTAALWNIYTGQSGPGTWTLPDLSANFNKVMWFKNASPYDFTIQRSGTDQIWTNQNVNSITIKPGESIGVIAGVMYWHEYLYSPNQNASTGGTWGGITGTLSSQTDLQNALNAKANTATSLAGYGITDAYTKTESDAQYLQGVNNLSDIGDAPTALTNLGGTTVGKNLFTLPNSASIRYLKINADNTVSTQSASAYLSGLGGVASNAAITGATKTKITYDSKGLVTAGADLIESDIPALSQSKITNLVTDLAGKQGTLTLTTTGTSGAATLVGNTLNIPQYSGGSGGSSTLSGLTDVAITTPSTGHILQYNSTSSKWENVTRYSGTSSQYYKGDGALGIFATDVDAAVSDADVTGKLLTGYAVGTNAALAATDNILGAMGKIQAQLNGKQASGSYLTSYTETDPVVKAVNGLVKSNGTTISAAVAGTDYIATESDPGVLTKALTGYTVGTNTALAATDNVLGAFQKLQGQLNNKQASGSYLTAESDPVVKAINGLVKSNGTTISAAVSGTDYVVPSGSITGTAANITATSNATLTTLSALSLPASQLTGTIATARLGTGTADATTYLGGDQAYHSAILSKAIQFISPTATENSSIWRTPVAITVTGVDITLQGTSPSVTYTINYGSIRGTATGTIVASNTVTTSGAATLNTTSIPANSYIWITTSAVSGTIDEFQPQINYRQ